MKIEFGNVYPCNLKSIYNDAMEKIRKSDSIVKYFKNKTNPIRAINFFLFEIVIDNSSDIQKNFL